MAKGFLFAVGSVLAAGTMPIVPAVAQTPCKPAIRYQLSWPANYPQYASYGECAERESEFRCPAPPGSGDRASTTSAKAAIVSKKG